MGALDGVPKELRRVIIAAEREGVAVRFTGSGHFQLRGADFILVVSQTPTNVGRETKRLRRDLKKHNITIP